MYLIPNQRNNPFRRFEKSKMPKPAWRNFWISLVMSCTLRLIRAVCRDPKLNIFSQLSFLLIYNRAASLMSSYRVRDSFLATLSIFFSKSLLKDILKILFAGGGVPAVSAKGGLMMGTKKVGILSSRQKRTILIVYKQKYLSSNNCKIKINSFDFVKK